MKFSQFNVLSEYEDFILIFNTLSTSFIKISKDNWYDINELLNGNTTDISQYSDYINNLKESGIICDKNKDELLPVKHQFFSRMYDTRYLSLSIAPTMQCNFDCYYCFEKGNKNYGLMTEEVADSLVEYMYAMRQRKIIIHWFGGEPLLGFERIKYICRKLIERKIEFSSTVITNGSLLTNDVINNIGLLNLEYIQISMDGIAKDHDKRRSFKNGGPTFDIIMKNLKNVMESTNLTVCIQITVDHSNINAYGDMTDYIKDNFSSYYSDKRILIGKNYIRNRTGFDSSGVCFTPSQILDDKISSFQNKNLRPGTPNLPMPCSPCMFRSTDSFAIDSRGNIYQCLEHLGNSKYRIGNLETGIISKDKFIETTWSNLPFDDKECKQCAYLPICLGGCPIDRIKRAAGEDISCCCEQKHNLVALLPHIYKNKYCHHEK